MYSVYADHICIYDDSLVVAETNLISPRLTMELNAAGTFTFGLTKDNPGYNYIELMVNRIAVYRDGEMIWAGRPVSESKDFYNNRTIICEGVLSYLNDIIFTQFYSDKIVGNWGQDWTPETALRYIMQEYNYIAQQSGRDFEVGTIENFTKADPIGMVYFEFETCLDVLQRVLKTIKGYVEIDYNRDGKLRINFRSSTGGLRNWQRIEFGLNLMDFVQSSDATGLVTTIVPIGGDRVYDTDPRFSQMTEQALNESNMYGFAWKVTPAPFLEGSTNYRYGYDYYVKNAAAVSKYGIIMKTIDVSDKMYSNSPMAVKQYGQDAANALKSPDIVIEITALDLAILRRGKSFSAISMDSFHPSVYDRDTKTLLIESNKFATDVVSYNANTKTLYIDQKVKTVIDGDIGAANNLYYEAYTLGDVVEVVSSPHGVSKYMQITRIDMPLDEPHNTRYTLGDDTSERLTSYARSSGGGSSYSSSDDYIPPSEAPQEVYSNDTAYVHSNNIVRINAKNIIRVQIDGVNKFAMRATATYLQYDQWHLIHIYETGLALRAEQPGETGRYKGQIDVNDSSITLSVVDKKDASRGVQMWFEPGVGIRANPAPWSSDRKKKYDIVYNVDGDLVDRLKPAYFKLKLDKKPHFGFIAQDVLEVTPEIVFDINVPDGEGGISESYMALNYHEFIPILTAKIQSQEKRIRDLEDKVQTLLELIQNGGESHG